MPSIPTESGSAPRPSAPPAVSDDELRDVYRAELARSSLRRIEERIGVGRTTLAKFLDGAKPTARIRRQLVDGCSGERGLDRYRGALALLAGNDARMQRATTRALVDLYRKEGLATPPWLVRLDGR